MSFTIISSGKEKTFNDKELVVISSKEGFDYYLNVGFEFMLTVQYNKEKNICTLLNQFDNPKFLFKGQPIGTKIEIDKICKIMIADSNEFITIKVDQMPSNTVSEIAATGLTEDDVKSLYGGEVNATTRIKLEKIKTDLEKERVSIFKQVSYKINELKKKISMNSKAGIVLHLALLFASLVCAFGVSNYLTGLPLKDAGSVIQMPVNLKLIMIYTLTIYGIGLMLKQGIFIFLQKENSNSEKLAGTFMTVMSSIFYAAVYVINVLYYISPKSFPIFAIMISLFFVLTTVALSVACGYFKSSSADCSRELDKLEYREDFEGVIKKYQQLITMLINNLSVTKIRNIKDKLFSLQLKSVGETIVGILTAPFLAYGVSNTLAMCFPEAAGWIRISGLRISPVFLVLATFLIIFAFFMFVNAFWSNKKILASEVLKKDGYSNYLLHGVEILGIEGVRRVNIEMRRSFIIGLCIIFIEFSMNVSYFTQEIGGDLSGLLLSFVAALVPTALLIAETYMLSQTKFEIYACEELISELDRD